MNRDLKLAFDELKKDVDYVHMKWTVYMQLYGSGTERHDLLNEMAGGFFAIVHDSLISDVLLSIARLTDDAVLGRYNNLSFENMLSMFDEEMDKEVSKIIYDAFDHLQTVSEDIREIRNKQLAHTDVRHRLEEANLPGITRQIIKDALEPIRLIMNTLDIHFYESERAYDTPIIHGCGDTIIQHLKRAKEHRECIRKVRFGL